ncbi:MAG: arsenic transporter [Firmicutes bacterium]|nr:arsenic transporter [Bacillota bacterium]
MLAGLLFVLVLFLILRKPWNLSIGWTAALGGAASLALGLVSWANVLDVVDIVWNATLTFVAVIIISLIMEAAGIFDWAALHVMHYARGHGLRLFVFLGILSALVAMFFANDGAALILTPIIYAQTRVLKLSSAQTWALMMVGGFLADTTSLPLEVSNLVNIVSASYFHIGFVTYALRMLPVDVLSFTVSLVLLFGYYRRVLPKTYAVEMLPRPQTAVQDARLFWGTWMILASLLAGYVLSQWLHWPVAIFAMAAAGAFLLLARARKTVAVGRILREAPWHVVIFSLGMYLIVYSLRNAGLTGVISQALRFLASGPLWTAALGTGYLAAVLSAVMNNMPTVLMDALAVHGAHLSAAMQETMVYSNIVGCDLGPKLTPIGSLATLLWMHMLAQRGVAVSWKQYMQAGVVLTIPLLAAVLIGLALWLPAIGLA